MALRHVLLAALISTLTASASLGATFAVDPVHSSAVFRIRHNNVSFLYGRINGPEGSIVYDAARPEASSFDITLKAANIDTANSARDTHLKSPTFFNAREMPNLTFKSTAVKKGDGDSLEVTGDLTIHGVKKTVTIKLDHTGDAKGQMGRALVGFEGTFTIKRSDYGMKEMLDAVGDEVRIMISFEAGQR